MKKNSLKLVFLFTGIFAFISSQAQYNIAAVGPAQGRYIVKDLDIATNLTGIHAAIEVPLGSYSMRFGGDYLARIGTKDTDKNEISSLLALKFLLGKVIGRGGVVQFPVFIGASLMNPDGDIKTPEDSSVFGVSGAAGVRFYISNRVAIFGEVVYDGTLLKDYNYTNAQGERLQSNVLNHHPFISVGMSFVYKKQN